MNNNIQCSIESSTTKIELNSAVEGVFLVPELEGLAGLPEIRTTSGVNAGYDGGWTSAQNYDARLISIRGVIANPDVSKVEEKRRAIASLLGQGRKEELTLRLTTEAGNSYAISVRTISCEMALQRVLTTQEFLIQLRADDPLIYDDGASAGTEAILYVQRALGGFEINFELPLAIGGGAEDTIVENGSEMVYPILKLYGPLHSPTVVNTTTNQQFQLNADLQYTINWSNYQSATGDYITISDGTQGAPLSLTTLYGNAEQQTYSGKNLWTLNSLYANTNSSAAWVLADTLLATPLPAGAYTFSFNRSANGNVRFTVKSTNKTNELVSVITGSSVTINYDYTIEYVAIQLPPNTTISNIMLVSGSTAGDYEPYVGGTASPNPDYLQAIETVTGEQTVGVVGKNLIRNTLITAVTTRSGVTITPNKDGSITLNGTATGNAYVDFTNDTFSPNFGLSNISGSASQTLNGYTFTAWLTSGQVNINHNTNTGNWSFRTTSGQTYTNAVLSFQLELGSTATTYEPYQGQSYEINLGKNLFDKDNYNLFNGYFNGDPTGTITANASNNILYVACQPNTTYTVSKTASKNFALASSAVVPSAGSAFTGRVSANNADSATITTSSTAKYLLIWARNGNISGEITFQQVLDTLQIERGSVATSWSPYFTPLELAKIGTYQDRIYKDGDKWYIEKQVGKHIMASGDGWGWVANDKRAWTGVLSTLIEAPALNTAVNGLCNRFKASSFNQVNQQENVFAVYTTGTMSFRNTSWATLDDAQADIFGSTVYYALATPTTTEITDETLLSQLNFIASLYDGVNNISLVGTGAQGEMEVEYATEYTTEQDVAVIDSQARTVTLNGQDAYHLKSDESEFLLLSPGENKLYLTSESSDDSGYAEVKFKQGYLSI